jgi:hypothetical protein
MVLAVASCGGSDDTAPAGGDTAADINGGAAEIPADDPVIDLSDRFTIVSAYADVNWETFEQYKAALHVHTRNSDGANRLDDVIEDHYAKGYDILAITDHNFLTRYWTEARHGITEERYAEIAAGDGRDGRFMLEIPYSNEQSHHDHLNTFFTDYNNPSRNTLENLWASLQAAEDQDGISHINHPGRYTGGEHNKDRSFDPEQIQKYTDIFMTFTTCVGMEIINKKDGESKNDRYLWDNINAVTIPQGVYVWGFSNDDTHDNNNTGYAFNMFLQPANNLDEFRKTMYAGNFYAVSYYAFNEGVTNEDLSSPFPYITNIAVDPQAASITITATDYTVIEWFNERTEVIATGNTINIADVEDQIGSFVRAHLIGPGAITWTQPFAIVKH